MLNNKTFIIAEAGVNHNGQLNLAFKLVDAALETGADAVKFQMFDVEKFVHKSVRKAKYQKVTTNSNAGQYEMLKKLELNVCQLAELKNYAERKGLKFLVSPFDLDSLGHLIEMGLTTIKIASGELTNGPLIWNAAKSGRNLIISTGMADISEIKTCLAVIRHAFSNEFEPRSFQEIKEMSTARSNWHKIKEKVSLLHCTSQYPTPLKHINLNAIDTLRKEFNLNIGFSDHTDGILASIAAAAKGATIIEKHITLDRTMEGPDHFSSLEPTPFTDMVSQIRLIEMAQGSGSVNCSVAEKEIANKVRQKVLAAKPIKKGKRIQHSDLKTARKESGLVGNFVWSFVGQLSDRDYQLDDEMKSNV